MKSYRIKIARKPRSVLGCISRSVGRRSREMINPLYLALAAAHGALRLVWSPRQDGHRSSVGGPWAWLGGFDLTWGNSIFSIKRAKHWTRDPEGLSSLCPQGSQGLTGQIPKPAGPNAELILPQQDLPRSIWTIPYSTKKGRKQL